MKIFRCAGAFTLYWDPVLQSIAAKDRIGTNFVLKNSGLHHQNHSLPDQVKFSYINHRGELRKIVWRGSSVDAGAINKENTHIEDIKGQKISINENLLRGLFASISWPTLFGKVVFLKSGHPSKYDYRPEIIDLVTGESHSCEFDLTNPSLTQSGIYGWDSFENRFLKLNTNFSLSWSWIFDKSDPIHVSGSIRSWTPTEYSNGVFLYLGHTNEHQIEVDGEAILQRKRGLMYCFYQDKPEVKWQHEFEYAVEDTLLHEDRLFVATANLIEVLAPESGELIQRINTGLDTQISGGAGGEMASLHINGKHLYYCHRKASCLLVYDIGSLELLHRLELPDGWCAWHFQFKDENTGRLYFDLILGPKGAPEYHRNAVLELHPDELGQPVTMESSPDVKVSLRPSSDDSKKQELWVEINCPSIDDALRFGELHTQNQAYINGHTLITSHCDPNPKFNGVVHFRYSGCTLPPEEVRGKMKVMEKRFEKWIDEASVYAGDKSKRLCRLDAQYIG